MYDFVFNLLKFFIQQAEEILGPGTGDAKKAAVIEIIKKFIELSKVKVPDFIMTNLPFIIDCIVFFYNAIGSFKKNQPSVPK